MGQVDIAGRHGHVPFMQVTLHNLLSPMSCHRRLPYKVQRRCLNLFRFWCGTAKGATKWMVELPNIVYRLVGIGTYARMASEGGTYGLVCIWLAFKM